MAKSYVKEYKKNGKGATPAISGMISTLESGSGMTREGIVAVSHADVRTFPGDSQFAKLTLFRLLNHLSPVQDYLGISLRA